jgi:hypothetical protein
MRRGIASTVACLWVLAAPFALAADGRACSESRAVARTRFRSLSDRVG